MTIAAELLRTDPRMTRVLETIKFYLEVRPDNFIYPLSRCLRRIHCRKKRDDPHILRELERLEETYGIPPECWYWYSVKNAVRSGRTLPHRKRS